MNNATAVITTYFINSIWEIPVLAGAGWLVNRLIRRLGPQTAHVAWVATFMLAIVIPALSCARSLSPLLFISYKLSDYSPIFPVSARGAGQSAESLYSLPAVLIGCLSLFYLGSVVFFTLRLAWSLCRTARLLRATTPCLLTPTQARLWSDCRQTFGLGEVCILNSSQIAGPVTLGLRKPILLMPSTFTAGCTSQDLLAAFAHECAHINRHDFQKNLLYAIGSLVVAVHPVTWLINSQIAKTREMVCDRMASRTLIDRRSYSESLLRLAALICMPANGTTLHAIGIFDANILEKRIMMLHSKQQQLTSSAKGVLIFSAALILLSAGLGGAAMAIVIHPETSSGASDQAMPEGPIYSIGKDVSAPTLIKSKDPDFPASARQGTAGFDGICLLRLIVDASGMPRDVHVTRALGPGFDANAIDAVQQYRFKPALRFGEPVAVSVAIEVHYKRY